MTRRRAWPGGCTAALVAALLPCVAAGAVIEVPTGGDALRRAVAAAAPGDTLRLAPGNHDGPLVIDRPLVIEGAGSAVVDGGGVGSVIRIRAPGTTVRGLVIRGSGTNGADIDAAVHAERTADGVLIEDNLIEGNLFGIVLQGPDDAVARRNRIANRNDLWLNNRGNGIQMWSNTRTVVEFNHVVGGRDGIFITSAHGNVIRGNTFEDTRFAVHYMYANRNEVTDNVSIRSHTGFALMFSDRLAVLRNVSVDDRDQGLLFHTSHRSTVEGNWVKGAGEKCVFIYTSTRNNLRANRFEGCGIGIHFTGGAEDNEIVGNAFVANRTQVKYSGTVHYEWSKDGRGNYWSDNPSFDLDDDGIADVAYRPNNIVDRVVWSYPLAKLLLASPAMETLRFAQSQFPTLYPGGVIDSHPLIAPPPLPTKLPDARTGT